MVDVVAGAEGPGSSAATVEGAEFGAEAGSTTPGSGSFDATGRFVAGSLLSLKRSINREARSLSKANDISDRMRSLSAAAI